MNKIGFYTKPVVNKYSRYTSDGGFKWVIVRISNDDDPLVIAAFQHRYHADKFLEWYSPLLTNTVQFSLEEVIQC